MSNIQLRPYQQKFISDISEAMRSYKHCICQAATGFGKCLGINTPIIMFDGSIKLVQDINKGDILMGADSNPRTVLSICSGRESMHNILPIKGDAFSCNSSHLLSIVFNSNCGTYKKDCVYNISVSDYKNLTKTQKHCSTLWGTGVEFEHMELPIDPWLLGLWIADGTKTEGSPAFTVNTLDIDILDELSKYNPYIRDDNVRGTCKRVSLGKMGADKNIYREEFRKCIIDNNHHRIKIPNEYKINSMKNRLDLLAGILDGDGYMCKNVFEIATKFNDLNKDILFLARSVGLRAVSKIKMVSGSPYNIISIYGNTDIIPNRLARKKASPRLQKKNALRSGFSIEDIGIGDYYGFEIDGDGLFLLGDFTVTHNTVCFSYLAQKVSAKGNKILILSNRAELLKQAGGSLDRIGVKAEYISPKHKKVPTSNVVVAMAQTLYRRYEKEDWKSYLTTIDLLIIDECHTGDFEYVFESEIFANKWVLGFSATPKRSGKMRQLGLDYQCIILGTKTQELIDYGFLVPARYFTLDAPDLSQVESDPKDGDYKSKQLQAIYDTPERYGGLVSEYTRLSPNTSSLCFCANQIHAIQTCIEFNNSGISAKYLVSGFGKDDDGYSLLMDTKHLTGKREDVISEFKRGEFLVLVNAKMLTTGFDAPNVFTVILNSATMSLSLYLQMIGRGSRLFEGKSDFKVLDFGGNFERHGAYEADRKWSVWHTPQEGSGVAPTKECPKEKMDKNGKTGCGRLILATYRNCPFCDYLFTTEKEIREIELTEIIGGKFQFRDMTPQEMLAYAELNGKSKPWAFNQIWMGAKNESEFKKAMHSIGYNWPYIYRLIKQFKDRKTYAQIDAEKEKKAQQSLKNV